MLQFYFLSILTNALAGYLLFFGDSGSVREFRCGFSVSNETFRLVVGILSAATGIFKVLSSIDIPVIGDIIPAATGFLSGFILIFGYYGSSAGAEDSAGDSERSKKIDSFLLANKKLIGAAAMVAAVLHFLLPNVLLF